MKRAHRLILVRLKWLSGGKSFALVEYDRRLRAVAYLRAELERVSGKN